MRNYHLISTIILFLLSACEEYHYIPDSEKFKYNEGDTIIFKSNLNDLDTFAVRSVDNGYEVHDKQYYWETEVVYVIYAGNDSVKKGFFINNFIEQNAFRAFRLTWGDSNGGGERILLDSVLIGEHIFYNIYDLEADTADINTKTIYKIYYSKNYGVLKYYYRNQTVYEFYKHNAQ